MALFCRIHQSKFKYLSNQFKRCYFQVSHASSLDSNRIYVPEYSQWVIPRRPVDIGDKVRFFAAPVQAKAKKEEKDTSGPRLNDKIKAQFIRLVTDDGHTILSLREALERARKLKLDLVEVQGKADPPVCKIMDFHREKYKQQLKEKDRAKGKAEVGLRKGDHKEIRFSGKTEDKDLRMKADTVKRLMERGYRVKCTARGSEDQDLGSLLSRLSALIEDVSIVESGPRVERGQAYVIVRHVKFGPSKKGGGKSWKIVSNGESDLQKGTAPEASAVNPSSSVKEEANDIDESIGNLGGDNAWSADDGDNDFEQVFDFKDDASKTTSKMPNPFSDRASSQPRMAVDSGRTSSPVSHQDSPVKIENRYKKIEPVNRFQQTNGMNYRGRGARELPQSETQTPDQRSHLPTGTNFSHSRRETARVENNNTPAFQSIKHLPNDASKLDPSNRTNPGSLKPIFGVFSSLNSNAPAATSRRGPPNTPAASPNTHRVTENTKLDDSLNKGNRSWGIFSKEGSNDLPSRISKP